MMMKSLLGASALVVVGLVGCGDDGGSTSGTGTGGAGTGGAGTGGGGTTTSATTGTGGAGGGAGVQCNVCADYGAAVPAVVSQIVDKAATDPQFEADFAPLVMEGQAAVDAFKASLTAFVSDAYGCTTGSYTGPSMKDAHTGMMITSDEYDSFVGLIAGVLADNGVPEAQITECFAPALLAPALKNDIVGQ